MGVRSVTQGQQTLQSALEKLVAPLCRAHGVELVDLRYLREKGGAVLRILIERPFDSLEVYSSGVSLDDCALLSRDISAALDMHEELLPGAYRLEVGSPGVERPLLRPDDYRRFSGHEVKVRTRVPLEGRRSFQGEVLGTEGVDVRLRQDGQVWTIPLDSVSKAHLVYRARPV